MKFTHSHSWRCQLFHLLARIAWLALSLFLLAWEGYADEFLIPLPIRPSSGWSFLMPKVRPEDSTRPPNCRESEISGKTKFQSFWRKKKFAQLFLVAAADFIFFSWQRSSLWILQACWQQSHLRFPESKWSVASQRTPHRVNAEDKWNTI